MQLCLSPRSPGDASLEGHVQAAAYAGFRCIDLWAPELEAYLGSYPVAFLDATLGEHGVYAAAVSGMEPLLFRTRTESPVIQAHFLELCTRLDALGGGLILAYPGPRPDWMASDSESADWAVHTLRGLADLAAPFEVRVAFEFRAGSNSLVRSLAQSQEIIRRTARSNVGLSLNTVEFHCSGGTPQQIDAVDIEALWFVRLGDTRDTCADTVGPEDWTLPGHGDVPLKAICEKLAERGFLGPCGIQVYAPPGDLAEVARAARDAVLEMFAPSLPA
jgi:2-keto-myo-inositol isomerase